VAIPVILDTDIGLDVDDVWALVFMLKCPELDVKLITTDTGDTHYAARLVAKLLGIAGRADIPIGIGVPLDDHEATHAEWLGDYQLEDYPGQTLTDGVGAICDTIMGSEQPVTLISIGPVPNLAAALQREPKIIEKSRFIGMHGSLRRGYMGAPKPMREYNVMKHSRSCELVFASDWHKTITPLDTCGTVMLEGDQFQTLVNCKDPLTKAVLDNHFGWSKVVKDWPGLRDLDLQIQSSVLYDTVAIYLAFSEEYLEMETLPIVVTPDGKTLIDESGKPVRCATEWKDQHAFKRFLVERLTS
jgi:inosine-uridine nucleoside N-ribohydrolase